MSACPSSRGTLLSFQSFSRESIGVLLSLQIGLGLPASGFVLVGRTRPSFLLVIRWQVTREASEHIVIHIVQNSVLPIVPTYRAAACRAAGMGDTVRSHVQLAASASDFPLSVADQKFIGTLIIL
jgi:hypothetical protein